MFKKGFYKGWLTEKSLIQLRKEITLNSLFISDYENSFGISPKQVCEFFDGFLSYIDELMEENGVADKDYWDEFSSYDTEENLLAWYGCFTENPFTEFED